MKVAPNVIFLFKDADGCGTAIADALQPNPNSTLKRLEDSFELSLECYGIKDRKASGNIVHFVDDNGLFQVSVLLLQIYDPPILACAINEVLASIAAENLSTMPTIVSPFIVTASKLKLENGSRVINNQVSLYGTQVGPETDIMQAISSKIQKPPSSLRIHHEPLACFLQLVRALKMPTYFLIGQAGQRLSHKTSGEEVICEIGELLASTLSLCFIRESITWNPTKTTRNNEEPWRALYG
ncbi:unnamed protein product [Ilex paraguariensis]|uniref:DUF7894 domain-containing protein n=1 Tax=Ilex paraguariensis TaxID=185542 RepID=A0ABC8TCM4_9AQUA